MVRQPILWLLIFAFLLSSTAAAVHVPLGEVEIGSPLPDPFSCLTYQGRSSNSLALRAWGCEGKSDDWLIVPKAKPLKAPAGWFALEFQGEVLLFEPLDNGNIRVYLQR